MIAPAGSGFWPKACFENDFSRAYLPNFSKIFCYVLIPILYNILMTKNYSMK